MYFFVKQVENLSREQVTMMTMRPNNTLIMAYLWGITPYDGLYRKLHLHAFFRFQVYEKVWTSPVEVYERLRKSVILVCKKGEKGAHGFVVYSYFKDSTFTAVKRDYVKGVSFQSKMVYKPMGWTSGRSLPV